MVYIITVFLIFTILNNVFHWRLMNWLIATGILCFKNSLLHWKFIWKLLTINHLLSFSLFQAAKCLKFILATCLYVYSFFCKHSSIIKPSSRLLFKDSNLIIAKQRQSIMAFLFRFDQGWRSLRTAISIWLVIAIMILSLKQFRTLFVHVLVALHKFAISLYLISTAHFI